VSLQWRRAELVFCEKKLGKNRDSSNGSEDYTKKKGIRRPTGRKNAKAGVAGRANIADPRSDSGPEKMKRGGKKRGHCLECLHHDWRGGRSSFKVIPREVQKR